VIISASSDESVASLDEFFAEGLRVLNDLLDVEFEFGRVDLLELSSDGGDIISETSSLDDFGDGIVNVGHEMLPGEDHSSAWTSK